MSSDDIRTKRLSREQAVVVLVDHQVGLVVGSRCPDPETVCRNTIGLVRAAQILEVPIVATTTLEGLFGPLFPELHERLAKSKVLERSRIDPFDDARVVDAIVATGRSQLIIAGVFASVCACLPSISAKARGYDSYAAIDASAAIDPSDRDLATMRMNAAGVTVALYGALVAELLSDNADAKARDVYEAIRSQYGVPTLASMRSPAAAGQ
jgi:nicotinamidase-related amidase